MRNYPDPKGARSGNVISIAEVVLDLQGNADDVVVIKGTLADIIGHCELRRVQGQPHELLDPVRFHVKCSHETAQTDNGNDASKPNAIWDGCKSNASRKKEHAYESRKIGRPLGQVRPNQNARVHDYFMWK